MYPCLKMCEFCLKPGQPLATNVRCTQIQAFEVGAAKGQQLAEARVSEAHTLLEVQPFQAVEFRIKASQTVPAYYTANVCFFVSLMWSQRPDYLILLGSELVKSRVEISFAS